MIWFKFLGSQDNTIIEWLGLDTRSVQPHRIRKSYGKERTFREDINERIHLTLHRGLSATISEGMRSIPAAGKTITLN